MASTIGAVSASRSSSTSTCSNSRARASPGVDGGQRLAQLGQQPGQLADGPARQQPGQPVGTQLPHQVPQHGGERRERQPVGPSSRQPPVSTRVPAPCSAAVNSLEQPGLTHPGLAADEHGGGRAVAHRGQRRPQRGQLVRAAHQRGADRRRAHAFQDATRPGHFRKVKPASGHGREPEPPAPAERFRPGLANRVKTTRRRLPGKGPGRRRRIVDRSTDRFRGLVRGGLGLAVERAVDVVGYPHARQRVSGLTPPQGPARLAGLPGGRVGSRGALPVPRSAAGPARE